MLKKIIFTAVTPLLLSACIGSQFVVDKTNNSATFPDLHDVPERPLIEARSQEALTDDQITQTHQEDLSENQRLRQVYGF